jgi:V/A-type H+-transporting ATPase subunit D
MTNGTRDILPTPSAVLELKEEHQVVREGYDFLDEKRLLLAAEMLRQLQHYKELMAAFNELRRRAAAALADAAAYHGLEGIEVYPAETLDDAQVHTKIRSFLGVTLAQTTLELAPTEPRVRAVNPSPEARRCRRLFRDLIERAAVLAGVSANLFRLVAEYRRTERRARALEDVILPEIEQTLHEMQAQLEETDQEEAIRTRLKYAR